LVVGCGWWKVGTQLHNQDSLFLLDSAVPHYLIFPHCDGIIHHGGSGTTHSASRAGKPQMVAPLLIDQFYWGSRLQELGMGPGSVRISRINKRALERRVVDLMTNPVYKQNAQVIGEKIRGEQGLGNFCDAIEEYGRERRVGLKTAEQP
jgi:UDP:flavonoid glycosyltransferase YjiC (YdhE family)